MAAQANLDGNILELGAGTGPITDALLKKTMRLEAVERDAILATHLKQRFPTLTVHQQDVEDVLRKTMRTYSSVLSGIPFAVMEKEKRTRVFQLIFQRLQPNGRFIMFQYSKTTEQELRNLFGDANVTATFVPWNVPPAFVFTCEKR